MKNMDSDGNGTVDFVEFCCWFKREADQAEADAPLRGQFKGSSANQSASRVLVPRPKPHPTLDFDTDGDGFISMEELGVAFGVEGSELQQLFESVDEDGDGKIDFWEFKAVMQEGQ